jgi:hypothetical protein
MAWRSTSVADELAAPPTAGTKEAHTVQKSPKRALDGVADTHNAILTQCAAELKTFLAEQS